MKDKHIIPTPRNMQLWAWRGVVAFALIVLGAGLIMVSIALPEAGVDTTPIHSDGDMIVPALGEEGYPVTIFCEDENTIVRELLVPDSSGHVYQIERNRGDVPEVIVWPSGLNGPFSSQELAQDEVQFGQVTKEYFGNWYVTLPSGYNTGATFYYTENVNGEQIQRAFAATIDNEAAECVLKKAI